MNLQKNPQINSRVNMVEDEDTIDLLELFFVLKSKILFIIAAMILCGGIMAAYSLFLVDPTYQSSSELYVLTKSTSLTSLADIQVGTQLTQDYQELIQSRTVIETVNDNLKLNYTYNQLLNKISITNKSNTRIIKLTVTDTDPKMAKTIVDELTEVSRATIASIMDQAPPSVVEYGNTPEKPIGPNKKKNVAIGMMFGAVLVSGIIVVLHLLDDTVKTAEDVEKYLELNTLASIPLREGDEKSRGKKKRKKKRKKKTNPKGGKRA